MNEPTYSTQSGDAKAIIEAAREHAVPVAIDPTDGQVQAFVVPSGAKLETVYPDDSYLPAPRRLTGSVTVEDVASFKAYVAQFYDAADTTAWVNLDQHRVVGVLNDAKASAPAWRDHRATLQLVKTPEWQRWRNLDGVLGGQEAFARHIEICEPDIVVPDAADLLEIAQTFHATTNAEFRSATRLSSGEVQFAYVEDTSAAAGRNGDLPIPTQLELNIAPFRGEEPVPVIALLRYRVREGNLTIGYELVRPDDVERAVMEHIALQLREDIDRVYTGAPAGSSQ